jgi:uncharacterized protein (TIGR00255 family)
MTGFAASEVVVGAHRLVWEIRSVNHRFLDLGFRLPEDFRALESELRKRIGSALSRGKVDCTLKLVAGGGGASRAEIDAGQLAVLRELERRVFEQFPVANPLTAAEILRWPGVLIDESAVAGSLLEPALAGFADAVAGLSAARAREGERLAELLRERLDAIGALMTGMRGQLVAAAPRYRDRLRERLARLDIEASPERLEQELALIAQRSDVTEEADRLEGHVREIRHVLGLAEPVGRRLDFLIQELNREANTLASKVQDDELARRAVDLKVLIEQMREQVQNIE